MAQQRVPCGGVADAWATVQVCRLVCVCWEFECRTCVCMQALFGEEGSDKGEGKHDEVRACVLVSCVYGYLRVCAYVSELLSRPRTAMHAYTHE